MEVRTLDHADKIDVYSLHYVYIYIVAWCNERKTTRMDDRVGCTTSLDRTLRRRIALLRCINKPATTHSLYTIICLTFYFIILYNAQTSSTL